MNSSVDANEKTSPFEVRIERFIDLDDDVADIGPLSRIKADGAKHHQMGIIVDGTYEDEDLSIWLEVEKESTAIGHVNHRAWSCRLENMIGCALVSVDAKTGDAVEVKENAKRVHGRLSGLPPAVQC